MCGRFTIYTPEEIEAHFDSINTVNFARRYNVRPSERAPVVRYNAGQRQVDLMHFGFRPQWMTDKYIKEKKRQPYINAKAETIFDTQAFKDAARSTRCLIPANGFYEPKGTPKTSGQPRPQYYFQLPGKKLFAFAGICTERTIDDGEIIPSFSILTVAANDVVATIHERMPVIIRPAYYDLWLGESDNPKLLQPLLEPWQGEALETWQVSTYGNKRGSEGAECIAPV